MELLNLDSDLKKAPVFRGFLFYDIAGSKNFRNKCISGVVQAEVFQLSIVVSLPCTTYHLAALPAWIRITPFDINEFDLYHFIMIGKL